MKFIFAIIPFLFLSACQPESKKDPLGNPIVKKKVETLKAEEGCQFISNAHIANILGINEAVIKQRPPQNQDNSTTCIWYWMQNGKRQSLYLRAERNPDVKKYPKKFDNFLDFSLKKGEKRFYKDGKEETVSFTEIPKLGNRAIWSEGGRILKWHYKNQFLFALSVDKLNSVNDVATDFGNIKKLAAVINESIE